MQYNIQSDRVLCFYGHHNIYIHEIIIFSINHNILNTHIEIFHQYFLDNYKNYQSCIKRKQTLL